MKFRFNFLPVFLRLMIISGLILFLFNSISTKQATAQKSPPLVGLVPDGPIDDQGFNQMAYEGLMRADSENLIEGNVYLPAGNEYSDYALAISQCVSAGNSLCIAVGFMMGDPLLWAATNHPGTAFAIVDMTWDESTYPANLRGMHFSVDEAAYLAGTLAGLMTETNKIGIVAGMDIPPVNDFVIPYLYGAQWAAPEVYVMVNYANDFSNEAIGADLADFQMGRGADIVFGVGGQMGNGAIKQACSHGVYCVGVDVDTYYTAFQGGTVSGADLLLTSVIKRVDNAVYDTIVAHVNGTFTPGTFTYNTENGGVGLAPYHDTEPDIPSEVIAQLNNVAAGIADGSVNVWQPFYTNFIYLPALLR